MQNRNATDKLNQQCSKLALVANTIIEICGKMTMLVYYIIDLAYHLHFYLQVTTNLQSSVSRATQLDPTHAFISYKPFQGLNGESDC